MPCLASGYIGTFTGPQSRARGIYRFTLNTATGVLEDLALAAESLSPAYLALAPSKKYLYAVNETGEFEGQPAGAVSAFARDEGTGALTFINRRLSGGKSPCHIAVDALGAHAAVTNYGSGTLCVFPLEGGGGLGEAAQVIAFSGSGPNRERQEGPHAHSFMFDGNSAFGFACDLGTDRLMAYRFNPKAAKPLSPAPVPWCSSAPGAGPRHGVFNPAGTFAYILNELDSTVDVLAYDSPRGSFEKRQCLSSLPGGTTLSSTAAAIRMSPEGRFLYASNRGHDSIACFTVRDGGGLEFIGAVPSGGKNPRDFNLEPSGAFLLAAHQDTDNLAVFRVNPATGGLTKEREYTVPSPVCVIFA